MITFSKDFNPIFSYYAIKEYEDKIAKLVFKNEESSVLAKQPFHVLKEVIKLFLTTGDEKLLCFIFEFLYTGCLYISLFENIISKNNDKYVDLVNFIRSFTIPLDQDEIKKSFILINHKDELEKLVNGVYESSIVTGMSIFEHNNTLDKLLKIRMNFAFKENKTCYLKIANTMILLYLVYKYPIESIRLLHTLNALEYVDKFVEYNNIFLHSISKIRVKKCLCDLSDSCLLDLINNIVVSYNNRSEINNMLPYIFNNISVIDFIDNNISVLHYFDKDKYFNLNKIYIYVVEVK